MDVLCVYTVYTYRNEVKPYFSYSCAYTIQKNIYDLMQRCAIYTMILLYCISSILHVYIRSFREPRPDNITFGIYSGTMRQPYLPSLNYQ